MDGVTNLLSTMHIITITILYQVCLFSVNAELEDLPLYRRPICEVNCMEQDKAVDYLNRRKISITESDIWLNAVESNAADDAVSALGIANKFYRGHKETRSVQYRTPVSEYKTEDVVKCFDRISSSRAEENRLRPVNQRLPPVHFAFLGDSLIRRHFLNFQKKIPDHDRKAHFKSTKYAEYYFHEDRNLTSNLFDGLILSFRWRPLIVDDILGDFHTWAANPRVTGHAIPDLIVIGLGPHHLVRFNQRVDGRTFLDLFEHDLMPLIQATLNKHPHIRMIWLRQGPTIDWAGPSANPWRDVNAEWLTNVFRVIRRLFFNNDQVAIWDSATAIHEEYLRACSISRFDRKDRTDYVNCKDYIHSGANAYPLKTNLLYNYICNSM